MGEPRWDYEERVLVDEPYFTLQEDIKRSRNQPQIFDEPVMMEEILTDVDGKSQPRLQLSFNRQQQDSDTSVKYAEDHSEEVGNARGYHTYTYCRAICDKSKKDNGVCLCRGFAT